MILYGTASLPLLYLKHNWCRQFFSFLVIIQIHDNIFTVQAKALVMNTTYMVAYSHMLLDIENMLRGKYYISNCAAPHNTRFVSHKKCSVPVEILYKLQLVQVGL